MEFYGNLVIDALCVTILVFILFANMKSCKGGMIASRIFRYTVIAGIAMFVIDVLGRMDGTYAVSVPWANQLGNFLLFALNPLVPLTWLFYVIYQVYGKVEILKKYAFLAVIYLLVNISTVVVNLFFGFYYQIDANNVYARGDFYAVSILLSLAPLVVAFFLTVISRNKIDVRKYNAFVFFPLSPIVGTILSFFTYGYSIVLPSMMIAYLLVFNSLKNDTMRTDYLTGVFNRRHLEDILRRKISESNSGFGAIMIDIDNYKSINDTHGHLVGDRALIDFANALQKSVGSKDFVARYGGDEFMIVVETKNKHSLEDVVASIKNNITRLNEQEIYPFKMNGSMGQDLYVPEEKMTMEQFINHLDNLMYKDKKTKR